MGTNSNQTPPWMPRERIVQIAHPRPGQEREAKLTEAEVRRLARAALRAIADADSLAAELTTVHLHIAACSGPRHCPTAAVLREHHAQNHEREHMPTGAVDWRDTMNRERRGVSIEHDNFSRGKPLAMQRPCNSGDVSKSGYCFNCGWRLPSPPPPRMTWQQIQDAVLNMPKPGVRGATWDFMTIDEGAWSAPSASEVVVELNGHSVRLKHLTAAEVEAIRAAYRSAGPSKALFGATVPEIIARVRKEIVTNLRAGEIRIPASAIDVTR